MTSLLKKVSLIHSNFIYSLSDTIGDFIVPILQSPLSNDSLIDIQSACLQLRSEIFQFLNDHCDKEKSPKLKQHHLLALDRAGIYFESISKGTLYDCHYQSTLHPLLIKIAMLLAKLKFSSSNFINIVERLSYAIQNKSCLDQHRDDLRRILIFDLIQTFDPPIRPIIESIYHRMDSQIQFTLSSWDHTVFYGYRDMQSVHSEHVVYLLLDDLFGIAGGTLSNETDILIRRTHLARNICRSCFNNKLSLKSLFSFGDVSWQSYFSKLISCGKSSFPSDFKLSVQDILDSPHFLSFFISTGVLSDSDLSFLKTIDFSTESDTLRFDFSWLRYSNESFVEETTYSELFVTILFTYIQDVFTKDMYRVSPGSSFSESSYFSDFDLLIENKLIQQYFLAVDDKEPFTLSEIQFAFRTTDNKEMYTRPFLKPFLSLYAFMIANCEASDASLYFDEILFPSYSSSWSFDCLSMLLCTNPSISDYLPLDKLSFFSNSSHMSLPHYFCKYYSHIIDYWVCSRLLSIKVLDSTKMNGGSSILFPLAQFYPKIYCPIIKKNRFILPFVDYDRDSFHTSSLHILSRNHPDSLYDLISNGFISLSFLSSLKDADGYTIFHWLSKYSPSILCNLIINNVLSLPVMARFIDNDCSTPFHWLAIYHGTVFFNLICNYSPSLNFFKSHFDRMGVTPFHLLAHHFPRILYTFFVEDTSLVTDVGFIQDFNKNTVFHWLVRFNPQIIYDLIETFPESIHIFGFFNNSRDCSLFHSLLIRHPEVFYDIFSKLPIKLSTWYLFRDSVGNTVFHLLARYYPDILIRILDSQFVTIKQLDRVVNADCLSPIHLIRFYYPDKSKRIFNLKKKVS